MGQGFPVKRFAELGLVMAAEQQVHHVVVTLGQLFPDEVHDAVAGRLSRLDFRAQDGEGGDDILVIVHTYSPNSSFFVAGLRYSPIRLLNVSSVRLMK